jgi:FlaA1/EpsC-like NDP-sugar epimerase
LSALLPPSVSRAIDHIEFGMEESKLYLIEFHKADLMQDNTRKDAEKRLGNLSKECECSDDTRKIGDEKPPSALKGKSILVTGGAGFIGQKRVSGASSSKSQF